MLQQIAAAKEKARTSVKAAREIGLKITETQAAGQPTGELEVQFDAAKNASLADLKALNRLESMHELEGQSARLNEPVERMARGSERIDNLVSTVAHERQVEPLRGRRDAVRRERVMQQEIMQRAAQFRSAGVENMNDYRRFREAHGDATEGYFRGGPLAAMRAFESNGFKPSEAFALVTTSGELGGFLVEEQRQTEILRDLPGQSVMRGLCRVLTTSAPALVFPTIQAHASSTIYSTGYAGSWRAEGYVTGGADLTVQNQPKFGSHRIVVYAWAPDAVEITNELISDAGADVEGIVGEAINEVRSLDEDSAFLNGNGVTQPKGLMAAASDEDAITSVNSGAAAAVTYAGLVDVWAAVPAQYRANARWMWNTVTYASILKLEDGQDRPLFGVNTGFDQLWGKPITINEFMPDPAAAAFPVLFGDFRYYAIADRQELRVQRLVEKFAPNIGLLPTARVGGRVLRKVAFRRLKCST